MAGPWEQYAAPSGPWSQYAGSRSNLAPVPDAEPELSLGEVAGDVAKSAGIGVVQGGIGLATLPGNVEALGRAGINAVAGMAGAQPPLSAETYLPTYSDWKGGVEHYTGEFYKPKTTLGEYARTVGEFAPAAIGGPAGMANRAARVALPAVVSETAGQATEGTSLEPWARMGGALLGGQLPNTAARAVTPAPANAARQRAVRALENEGVTALTAGQRTGNARLRQVEDATALFPGGGGRATTMQQTANEQFTRATLARAGIQADRVTPDVLNTAFHQIGREFQNFGGATNVRPSTMHARRAEAVAQQYANVTPPALQVPVVAALANDMRTALRQGITGQQYNAFRSNMQREARGLKSNPQAANAVQRMVQELDSAMLRSTPPAQRSGIRLALQDRNRRYRNLLAIEDASGATGEAAASGLLTPAALKAAIKKNDKKGYTRNRNDMAPLARAGTEVMTPLKSSGTAERTFAQSVVSAPSMISGGAAAALTSGDPWMMMGAALAPPVIKAATARGIMSGPAQRYFANQRIPHDVPRVPFMPSRGDGQVGLSPLAAMQFEEASAKRRMAEILAQEPLRGGIGPRYEDGSQR